MKIMQLNAIPIVALIIALVYPGLSSAEEIANSASRANSLKAGSNAVLFSMNSGFTISGWNQFIVGYKHHFTPAKAVRIGFDAFWTDQASKRTTAYTQTGIITESMNDGYTFSIDLLPEYVKYFNPSADANLYYATGIYLGFRGEHAETYDGRSSEDDVRWKVGPAIDFGAEWFAAHNISFIAEYQFALFYIDAESTRKNFTSLYETYEKRQTNSSSWNFNSSSARLGLALYF